MSTPSDAAAGRGTLAGLVAAAVRICERTPADAIAVLARLIVGLVFWQSGRTKVDGFSIKSQTFFLFREEYALPLISPETAAYLATFAEHVFPVLLFVGLATRLSAAALLFMTLVIQVFVYPESYITHGLWAIGLLCLMRYGPGRLSVDHVLRRRYMGD